MFVLTAAVEYSLSLSVYYVSRSLTGWPLLICLLALASRMKQGLSNRLWYDIWSFSADAVASPAAAADDSVDRLQLLLWRDKKQCRLVWSLVPRRRMRVVLLVYRVIVVAHRNGVIWIFYRCWPSGSPVEIGIEPNSKRVKPEQ